MPSLQLNDWLMYVRSVFYLDWICYLFIYFWASIGLELCMQHLEDIAQYWLFSFPVAELCHKFTAAILEKKQVRPVHNLVLHAWRFEDHSLYW